MTAVLWVAVAVAGVAAITIPYWLRPLCVRWGIVDIPNGRSSHSKPTVRGGGVAPLLGWIIGTALAVSALPPDQAVILGICASAVVATSLVGLAEDVRGLPVVVRAGLQLACGVALATALSISVGSSLLWVPLAGLFFAANVNFTNFMDGVNGISALHGLVAGLAFAVLGALHQEQWLMVGGLLIAVLFITFLPWNMTKPGFFLGDVGSYLLGAAVAAAAMAAMLCGVHPVAALAPLCIYWADTVTTLLRRTLRREPICQAHRNHTYQRLTDTGLSHTASALVVAGFTTASTAVGLLTDASLLPWPVALVLISGLASAYLLTPHLRDVVFTPSDSTEFEQVALPEPSPAMEAWKPRRWAVLGASGFIGSATSDRLEASGIEVIRLTAPRLLLDPCTTSGPAVVTIAEGMDATDRLAEALNGVDVVVNAAGLASPDAAGSAQLYGANVLLPAVTAVAAERAKVGRVLHLSSAAVQGARPVLDASTEVAPFSPYSRSKALGERALLAVATRPRDSHLTDLCVIRGTSVQGSGRRTTESLRRFARSPFASVASPGNQPTVVSTLPALVDFILAVGHSKGPLPPILLQPWEGLSVTDVLRMAGGRNPKVLPAWFCRAVVEAGQALCGFSPTLAGLVRRMEVTWFGQRQEAGLGTRFFCESSSPTRAPVQGSPIAHAGTDINYAAIPDSQRGAEGQEY